MLTKSQRTDYESLRRCNLPAIAAYQMAKHDMRFSLHDALIMKGLVQIEIRRKGRKIAPMLAIMTYERHYRNAELGRTAGYYSYR